MVEALINGYPDAVKSREETWGRLPLHLACIYTASAQVHRLLVETYEESLRITDKIYGRLPLHFACLYGSPFEIALLVSAEQRALVFKDVNGKTPKDLAEESNNPHREAILKRLEDRTKIVTEAMIQRRKSYTEYSHEQPTKKSSMRRRGLIPMEDIQIMNEKRRAKSMGLGVIGDDETVRKSNLLRTKSSGISEKKISSRSAKGPLADLDRMDKRTKTHTKDDLDIGKKSVSKPSRRKRVGSKTSSIRHENEQQQSDSSSAQNVAGEDNDVEKTPKSKNTRGLSSTLMRRASCSEIYAEKPDGKKKPTKQTDRLAMFLQSQSIDSSGDEYETDHKSMGARSLPAHMHSTFSNPLETAEKKRIAKTFMFEDSDDAVDDVDVDVSPTAAKGTVVSMETESSRQEKSELVAAEERLRNLDIRREALSQECEAIYDTVAKKEDAAERCREVINQVKRQMIELQERLEKEQMALSLYETGIQLQKETLAVHEIKIRAVDSEKSMVLTQKAMLEEKVKASIPEETM